MLKVNKKKIFRIRGKFPSTGNRYFSLQANNPDVRTSICMHESSSIR